MRHFKIGLSLMGIALAAGLSGCADENPWGNTSNEKGKIDLSLTTDSDIKTAKPVFRSGEDETRAAGTLGDFITVPTADDFSIRLEKNDGSFSKTWATLADFKAEAENGFNTGTYTLTAFYGEKGKQDFESPYFEATAASFTVLSDQTSTIDLTAELKNSMVKINYTDAFKSYMQDYHTTLRTEGRSDEIVFSSTQTKPAFIEAKNAALTVHFTTRDKGFTSTVSLGEFAPVAKTLHNITFDVGENKYGDATLEVNFDDTLTDENFTIDLTDELLTTPTPVITCEGFADGLTIDMLEGSGSDTRLKMSVFAEAGIKSALMTVESTVAYKPEWGYDIDLCAATEMQQQQLLDAGIQATGLYPESHPAQMAFLDLTDYGKKLKNGVYTISLIVTDKNGAVSKTTKVILNSLPVTIDLVGEPTIVYNSGQAVLTFDYNGLNPMQDLTFTAEDDLGNDQNCRILSCEETSTRAFETKRYIFTIELPNTTKSMIRISAYHNNKNIGTYKVTVIVPQYNISDVDAFSRYAYLKVATPGSTDPTILAAVTNNIQLRNNLTIAKRDAANGIITVTGLTPGSNYTLESSITGGDTWQTEASSINTETELTIPNGDFSQTSQTINMTGVQVGGTYTGTVFDDPKYHWSSSIVRNTPNGWASINEKTCWTGASNINTWFCVPSTYAENGVVTVRSVGYDHDGTTPPNYAKTAVYYNENAPTFGQGKQIAGELFLGSYSFNGSETRNEGVAFSSRPISITFDYSYAPLNNETASAEFTVCDASGKEIASVSENLVAASSMISKTIKINRYSEFGGKAAAIKIKFKSSTASLPAINIPSGSALKEKDGVHLSNGTLDANSYHAVATGSVLKIDNVTANYDTGTSSASAPKRKTTSTKK